MTEELSDEMVYMVLDGDGILQAIYPQQKMSRAFARARNINGLVIRLPVWMDFR